jgi:hypothetical protein
MHSLLILSNKFIKLCYCLVLGPGYCWQEESVSPSGIISAFSDTLHGFMKGCLSTTSLASAHALLVAGRSKVVIILAFDLLNAFRNVAKDQLVPKMIKVGITSTPIKWLSSKMTGLQSMDQNGSRSVFVGVLYVIRQGLILGRPLYLLYVAVLPASLNRGKVSNSVAVR